MTSKDFKLNIQRDIKRFPRKQIVYTQKYASELFLVMVVIIFVETNDPTKNELAGCKSHTKKLLPCDFGSLQNVLSSQS